MLMTDCRALLWTLKSSHDSTLAMRAVIKLEEFEFDAVHVKGSMNKLADMCSRVP